MSRRKRWNYKDIEKFRKWFEGKTATTQKRNARKLKVFCEWINKEPEKLLQEFKEANDKKVKGSIDTSLFMLGAPTYIYWKKTHKRILVKVS